jgi:Cu2+-exporting ATPase
MPAHTHTEHHGPSTQQQTTPDASHSAQQAHSAHVDHSGHELVFRNRFWVCLLLTVPVLLYSHMLQMWFGFTPPQFPGSDWIGAGFAIVIFVVGGVPFLRMAGPEIRNRKPGMMVLISLAISVAFIYSLVMLWVDPASGFFWEMALLIDVMLLGHWLEMRSVRQASGALGQLARLLPDMAERIGDDGAATATAVADLRRGDLLLVRPGASIPADGTVEQGSSAVNEAMITGESIPVDKRAGDAVIAGAINGDGSLRVRVTATGDETALAGIMRLVDEAQRSKSATQLLADRAAGWLFYIALAVAAMTAIVWTIVDGFNWQVVERVVTVLVIACPHALGLAVPLVVAISTSLAARNGILVRNRLALEEARLLNTIVFDKTGTLTTGAQTVVGSAVVAGGSAADALALAAAAEGDSEHMIAGAIRRAAQQRSLTLPSVGEFAAIKGRGIQVRYEGRLAYIGGPRLLEILELTPPVALTDFASDAGQKGQSVVFLLVERQVVAAFAIADAVHPESKAAVAALHGMGKEVAMLTGDSEAVARTVAAELGIDHYFAQVLPEQKDAKIAELQRNWRTVAMVGDGVNDAPALTRADVGIAIGGGTDVAIESAGIILVRSNPLDVVKIVKLSFATYRKMVQNLWWAAGYNIVALPLAAGILAPIGIELSPAVGAALMAASTLVVAINAQTLRRADLTG